MHNSLQDMAVSEGGEKESQLIRKLVNPPPDNRELPVCTLGVAAVLALLNSGLGLISVVGSGRALLA
jgi:hypothetical protein